MDSKKFKTLKEWATQLGDSIPASTLRAEVLAGNINAIRARPSCNAPILISEVEMARWLENVAGKRQLSLSPAQASSANKSGGRHAS